MRIVIAVHHFLPTHHAGSEQHTYRICREMLRRGHEVRVVCIERIDVGAGGEVTWEDEVFDGIPVRRLSFNLGAAPDPRRWEYDNPWVGDQLRALLQAERPDVFHLFSGYLMTGRALRVARELDIPSVLMLTDFWFLCPRITMLRSNGELSSPAFDPVTCARCLGEEQRRYRLPGRLFPGAMQWLWRLRRARVRALVERDRYLSETLQQTDQLVAFSEFVRRIYLERGIAPERIELSRQGIDTTPHPAPRQAWQPPLQIGYLGQLAPQKGVDVLIEAVRQLAQAPIALRIYGNPNAFPHYSARLRQLAAEDPRITFAGTYQGAAERSVLLGRLDVTVVPSVWYENNPMSINESLGDGVPVLTTDLGSMREAVTHGVNGLLFQRGDARDLANQIRRLIEEPQLLTHLRAGITPRRTVSEEADQIESVYRQIIARKSLRSGRRP